MPAPPPTLAYATQPVAGMIICERCASGITFTASPPSRILRTVGMLILMAFVTLTLGVPAGVSNHSNPATDYHFKCRHFERRASVSRRLRGDQLRGAKDGWRISSRWQSIRQSSDWRG